MDSCLETGVYIVESCYSCLYKQIYSNKVTVVGMKIALGPTSFPGSLFSASLGHWKKDPGCGWSHDHPESGW